MAGLAELQEALAAFYDERDWRQFQTPKDVAAALSVEAGELQELFLWLSHAEQQRVLKERHTELRQELADVMINCLNLARLGGVDLETAVREKLMLLERRYPAAKVRGRVIPHG
jgi:NTP pyrophosphatase (non-canonical NTP hydrolase)